MANVANVDDKAHDAQCRRIGWLANASMGGFMGATAAILTLALYLGAQGSAGILFLFAGIIISWLAGPGYLELVLMYPKKVGGVGAVCHDAFKPYNSLLANLTGTCYIIGWITGSSYGALLVSTIVQQFLPGVSIYWLSTFLILATTGLSFFGLYWVTRLTIPIAILAFILTILACLIPFLTGQIHWEQVTHLQFKSPFATAFGDFTGIMAGIYLIGWMAPAVCDGALSFMGETVDPKKNAPRAMVAALSVGTFYYIVCPIVFLGALGIDSLVKDQLGQELIAVYSSFFGPAAKYAAAGFMIFSFLIWLIVPLQNLPRILSQLSKDGLVPRFFSRETNQRVPWVSTFFISTLSVGIIWLGTPQWLIAATNFAGILAYFLVAVAIWLLRRNEPDAPRLYRAPYGFVNIGLLIGFLWIIATIFGFQQYGLSTMVLGILFSFSGTILYLWRQLSDREKGRPLRMTSLHNKLTIPMITVLSLDAIGYLVAVNSIQNNIVLITLLEDIFVLVALLTIAVGIILPGIIAKPVIDISIAAKELAKGTLNDFSRAMQALGEGRLEAAHAQSQIIPVISRSNDEISDMAVSFNLMQEEIKNSAIGLNLAREGLREARNKIMEVNLSLENRVKQRTQQLESEFSEHKKTVAKNTELNKQLVMAARSAGMADIATSILHNVGNVLNSINISASLIQEKITLSKMKQLNDLSELLQTHKDNLAEFFLKDSQGEHIPEYLKMLAATWNEEQENLKEETNRLCKSIMHVKHIISMQQTLNTVIGLLENTSLVELIEDAISFNKINYEKKAPIEIICDFNVTERILIDRIKLLQVMVNLIKNGIESLLESEKLNKQLILRLKKQDANYFIIQVMDNGIGIAEKNKTLIFTYGFTTKKEGHGFGLHSCANAAQEMGGKLIVESEENQGATFTLILPFNPPYKQS